MTLGIKGIFATLNINVSEHNNTLYRVQLCLVSRLIYCYAECYDDFHYTECRYAECRGAV
jgi:hypothetical protein